MSESQIRETFVASSTRNIREEGTSMSSRNYSWFVFAVCSVVSFVFLLSPMMMAAPQGSGYKILRRIPVGGEGNWDYLRVDPDAHRLYVARGTHVMIVDET